MVGVSTHHKALAAILEGNRLMKYKILIADTVIGLAESVNREMALEWRPLGGIAIYNAGPDGISYYQAMEASRAAAPAEVLPAA
jgi:hypothetical protein